MPAAQPSIIIQAILDAIEQSGGSGGYTSSSERIHPRTFVIQHQEQLFSLWVYIWTLTHGGRKTLPYEYRIQMTSVKSPLQVNPDGYTALLGFYPDLNMFAGFDLTRHRTFSVGSPSVQIDIHTLHDALQNGLAFSTKDNQEIAVGIRPDQLLHYILNAQILHKYGADANVLDLLKKATLSEAIEEGIRDLTAERQRIISKISRYSREANFRKKVLNAYDNRCAVTRFQLKLVDAAHILPVASEDSSDHVFNGIALSPTMHRAYDTGLIFLDEDYYMRLNKGKAAELKGQNLDGGLSQLCSFLDQSIHLPLEASQRPKPELIRQANQYRRIPDYI